VSRLDRGSIVDATVTLVDHAGGSTGGVRRRYAHLDAALLALYGEPNASSPAEHPLISLTRKGRLARKK
jgi:hypothetical protein